VAPAASSPSRRALDVDEVGAADLLARQRLPQHIGRDGGALDVDERASRRRHRHGAHPRAVDGADVDDGVELAVTRPEAPAPDVLERLAMGFLPVPPLDPRAPSTSYFIRGHELRVDLLTPLLGRESKPQFVPALGAPASPVRHLDFVLVDPVVALAIGPRDLAVIQVPAPARFALHKLMVSTLRPAVFATKADKDRQQAMQLLHALVDNAPDDIAAAWTDLQGRGPGWTKKIERALGVCRRADPALIDALRPLLNG